MSWIDWCKQMMGYKAKPVKEPKKVNTIIFDDDKVKQLEPIYRPGYICTAKDCKCDNKCKEIIGWREK